MGAKKPNMDVLVIGAGLIGLGCAYELAKRGASVRVFDVRDPGSAASWAGAGILAPYSEPITSPELAAFCVESLGSFPAFVDMLRADGGIDPYLRTNGNVTVAYDALEADALRARAAELRANGVRASFLTDTEARTLEPALGPDVLAALFVEEEGQVDNRRLWQALRTACASRGVRVTADVAARAIEADERRVRGVRTSQGFIASSVVINAAGAWAAQLEGVPAHARVPVEPIKGQMLALEMPEHLVRHVVWFPARSHGYVVPRGDGRLLIGATVERACFDTRVTARGIYALLETALRVMPALADLTVLETWAGVRPGSPDGVPFIGMTDVEGYVVAAGHFRYGILLTPATARLVADVVEGRALPAYASALSPRRRAEMLVAG